MTGAAETAADPGPLPELAWLPVDRLEVDPAYQRSLDTPAGKRLIDKIASGFSWIKFGALMAVPGGGDGLDARWKLIDGQHRSAGARLAGVKQVPAVVFAAASLAQQAAAFVGANRDRVPMSAQALYHAQLLARDPEALIIGRICEREHIRISPHNKSAAKFATGETAAIAMLQRILRKHGEDHLARSVNILNQAWGQQPGALQSGLFMAVSMYLAEGGDEPALRHMLPRRDWRRLLDMAVNTGGAEHGRGRALCDTLKAWVAQAAPIGVALVRTASPHDVRNTDGARPSGHDNVLAPRSVGSERGAVSSVAPAAPLKVGPLPAPVKAGPLPVTPGTGAATAEDVAEFLRQRGRKASVVGKAWQRKAFLDGERVAVERLYDAANELRRRAGLPEVRAA